MYRLSALAMMLLLALSSYGQQAPLGLEFVVSDVTETTVDIDLVVEDFTDITLIQLFLFWDENVLQAEELVEFAPALGGFTSVLPSDDNADPSLGKLRLNWFDLGAGTQTLDDGTVLCRIRYQLLGSECSVTDFTIDDLGEVTTSPSLVVDVQAINATGIESIGLAPMDPFEFQVPGSACSTSTEDEEIASVRIYPNPVRDNLQVTFNNHQPDESSLMLYNEEGRLLSSNPLRTMESNIDISQINNGIYFYEIQDKGVVVNQGKIMKI